MFEISVHICTHNPRPDYLRRTLEGLKAQTLPVDRWELLLVDNASTTETAKTADLSWHPNARYVSEPAVGKMNALITAIRGASAKILVTVDDDNVLYPDYLERAILIADKYRLLGSWGGQLIPEFEETPPEWTRPYWVHLAIREFDHDRWSNLGEFSGCVPVGAGMVLRAEVALLHVKEIENCPVARRLDRHGKDLGGAGDTHLALAALKMGLGNGIFKDLKIKHLMPTSRFTEDYFLSRFEGGALSRHLYEALNGAPLEPKSSSAFRSLLGKIKRLLTMSSRERKFAEARMRGYMRAAQFWKEVGGKEMIERVHKNTI